MLRAVLREFPLGQLVPRVSGFSVNPIKGSDVCFSDWKRRPCSWWAGTRPLWAFPFPFWRKVESDSHCLPWMTQVTAVPLCLISKQFPQGRGVLLAPHLNSAAPISNLQIPKVIVQDLQFGFAVESSGFCMGKEWKPKWSRATSWPQCLLSTCESKVRLSFPCFSFLLLFPPLPFPLLCPSSSSSSAFFSSLPRPRQCLAM